MESKRSNLCLSVDVTSCQDLLKIADAAGPFIVILKTHVDILLDFPQFDKNGKNTFIDQLESLAKKHKFFIFEDRKFADIGNTVSLQYKSGVYRISSWAHITNCHAVPGDGIIKGLKAGVQDLKHQRACLMIAEMSSKGSLATGQYTTESVEMSQNNRDFIIGFIAQQRLVFKDNVDFLTLSPGVQLEVSQDQLGQQYRTPETVITQGGSDIIIVGRGIIGDFDQLSNEQLKRHIESKAKIYQERAWSAYLNRINQ